MMRWLLNLICLILIFFVNFPMIAYGSIGDRRLSPEAEGESTVRLISSIAPEINSPDTISEAQWQQSHEIAKKAIFAAKQGDFKQSETYWTELIGTFPNNPAIWSNRGNIRVAQHKLDEAIADFDRAIELAPKQPDPYLNRGVALEGQGKYEDALNDYDRVLALNPEDPMAYNNRGNARAGQQRWLEALTDYQKAIELSPNFAIARANAALVSYQIGNKQEAMQSLRNLVRKYPMFADLRAAFTAILWDAGQQGEAESNWVATVGIDARYQDLKWVKNIRRWPPQMVAALEKFLTLN
jgi:tetratricopeptide (TPR) repeat protein